MLREFFEKYQIGDAAVAAGVSGGADSLALLFQLDAFLRPQGRRVIALTVDHGLRPESRDEAEYVAKLAAERQIEHHILTWEGKKPEKGIEEAARTARYGLLCGWCRDNGVGTLAVAHHLLDQAETFFMRLQRGSGLNGLCGMAPLSEKNGVRLIRPFLQVHPERLKEFLRERGVSWAEDPFNRCDDYLRVRVRKFLPQLAATLDITPERIADTMSVLARSRDCLEEQVAQFVDRHVRRYEKAGFSVSRLQLAGLHAEVCFRVLCFLLKETGRRDYIPRADDVDRLQRRLFDENFRGATLAGCEIVPFRNRLWIVPELKGQVRLSKKDWGAYAALHPQYGRLALPYKLKLSLYKSS